MDKQLGDPNSAPVTNDDLTLDSLIEQITAENRRDEIGTGEAVGNEV